VATTPIHLNSVAVERGEGGVATLTIEVAASDVQAARERAIKQFSKRLRVPGFRPGHIPANVVRRNVGDEAIAQEVSEQLVPLAYEAAIAQENIQPLERGEVDQLTFDAFDGERPLVVVARVIARPVITLGQLEGLTAVKQTVNITENDVEEALEKMREQRAYLVNVQGRGAENGDVLFAELQVFVDGEPRSEEPAKLRGFVLGSSGFVPAIDEHLVGLELDGEKTFNLTYPDDYQEADLAGREAEFRVKVTAIKNRVVPEITTEFAQITGYDSVEELRAQLGNHLRSTAERDSRQAVRTQIVKQISDSSELEVPTALVEVRLRERLANIEQELKGNGATVDAYLQSIGSTQEQMENDLRVEIAGELKSELVLDEIAARENLPVSRAEIEQHYLLMARVMEQPVEDLVQNVPIANVRTSILQRKAIDWLIASAIITDENGAPVNVNTPAIEDETSDVVEEEISELEEIEAAVEAEALTVAEALVEAVTE